jgi:hypothetical protein
MMAIDGVRFDRRDAAWFDVELMPERMAPGGRNGVVA